MITIYSAIQKHFIEFKVVQFGTTFTHTIAFKFHFAKLLFYKTLMTMLLGAFKQRKQMLLI